MLKLRNAVLTALLAFCLAMPFVSCSFNDGATGDVSGDVKVQPGNNQNGGNGGSTGGNEKPSGGDEDHDHDNNGENVDNGDNGENEKPSGGNGGSTGGNEKPSGGNGGSTGGNEKPGEGTTYVVKYKGDIIEESLPEWMWSYGVNKVNLIEGDDYAKKGNEITLTDSGYQKVLPLLGNSGGDGGQEVIPPVTDGPVTDGPVTDGPVTDGPVTDGPVTDGPVPDVPGDVEGTMYTVMYNGAEFATIPASELSHFETVLIEDTDYTISGTVITLTDSGFEKVNAAMHGAGE